MASRRITIQGPRGGRRILSVAQTDRYLRESVQLGTFQVESQFWHRIDVRDLSPPLRDIVYEEILKMTEGGHVLGVSLTFDRPSQSFAQSGRVAGSHEGQRIRGFHSNNDTFDENDSISKFYRWVASYEDDEWTLTDISWKELE